MGQRLSNFEPIHNKHSPTFLSYICISGQKTCFCSWKKKLYNEMEVILQHINAKVLH